MPDKKGFTLVEMLFVLSIIIVLGTFTLHYSITTPILKTSLNQQCNYVIALLEEAKTLALTSHQQVDINISNDEIGYLQANLHREVKLADEYYFSNSYEFHFNKNGNISSGGRLEISGFDQSQTIILNVGSGAFYVK